MSLSPEIFTIVTSIIVFLLFIFVLVGVILLAKNKLAPSGPVKIKINRDDVLEVESGGTLLTTLGNSKIFLPSACGGGGTCAMCKCQVLEGGGEILPTESPYFTRKQIKDNWRLGCQVKVRQDMEILVPEEIFGIKKYECEVVSNNNVSTFIKELILKFPEGQTLDFKPGSYIQLDVPPVEVDYSKDLYNIDDKFRSDYDKFKMWGLKMKNPEPEFRAYSMANHPTEGNIVMLNIRIATPPWDKAKNDWADVPPGKCSSYAFSLKPKDKVTLSGPYGEFHIKDTRREMIYIGGGAGMAPLRSHIFHLFHTLKTDRKVAYWYGGRSKKEIFYEEDFRNIETHSPNFEFHIALSSPLPADNWDGYTGFIHQVCYDNYLKHHPEPEEIEYYLCGPPMMNSAVLEMLDSLGVPRSNIAFDDFGA